jgi:hypothetical protein
MNDEIEGKSRIYIEFDGVGSATITKYTPENVTPMQLLALAQFLDFEGKASLSMQRAAQMQQQIEMEKKNRISVPEPGQVIIGKK